MSPGLITAQFPPTLLAQRWPLDMPTVRTAKRYQPREPHAATGGVSDNVPRLNEQKYLADFGWTASSPPDLEAGHGDSKPLPVELSLRELIALDPRDPAACIDFAVNYGMPVNKPFCSTAEAAGALASVRLSALHILASYQDRRVGPIWVDPSNWANDTDFYITRRECFEENWMSDVHDPDDDERVAWNLFPGSVSFYAREAFPDLVARRGDSVPRSVSLACACALELCNIVADQPPMRTCRNCDRKFFLQRGSALYGQHHRSGEVHYCSKRCRKNYQEAQRRKRKKVEKEKR